MALHRYRKGDAVKWAGREWYDMHGELMIVASEAILPLGITAVFASRGGTSVQHAYWGYYLIVAVALQIFTGWMRTKGLEAKHSNFSLLHRVSFVFTRGCLRGGGGWINRNDVLCDELLYEHTTVEKTRSSNNLPSLSCLP